MFCKYCGAQNDDNAANCAQCHAALDTPAAPAAPIQGADPSAFPQAAQNYPPYSMPPYPVQNVPSPATEAPLRKFRKSLTVFAMILSILSFNWVAIILSVIAMTKSYKYKAAVAANDRCAANTAAKTAKVLSIISIILSLLLIAAVACLVPFAIRYTNLGLLF